MYRKKGESVTFNLLIDATELSCSAPTKDTRFVNSEKANYAYGERLYVDCEQDFKESFLVCTESLGPETKTYWKGIQVTIIYIVQRLSLKEINSFCSMLVIPTNCDSYIL